MSTKQNTQCYSLDILSDGSDYTGVGSLFLTVSNNNSQRTVSSSRYAFNLPENLVRMCSDRAYKLSTVKAAFLTSKSVECCVGLSGLCLNLSGFSYHTQLSVCGPVGIGGYCDFVVGEVTRRQHPKLETCEVEGSNGDDNSRALWWQEVYEDEFVCVFGRAYLVGDDKESSSVSSVSTPHCDLFTQCYGNGNCHSSSQRANRSSWQVVYICTVKNTHGSTTNSSFAVMPAGARLTPLPKPVADAASSGHNKRKPLDFVVELGRVSQNVNGGSCPVTNANRTVTDKVYSVQGFYQGKSVWDAGILRRAAKMSQTLNANIPCAFPVSVSLSVQKAHEDPMFSAQNDGNSQIPVTAANTVLLRSGDSLVIENEMDDELTCTKATIKVGQMDDYMYGDEDDGDGDGDGDGTHEIGNADAIAALSQAISEQYFLNRQLDDSARVARDDNEIDIDCFEDDEDEIDDENENEAISSPAPVNGVCNLEPIVSPFLQILGTGSATPSATRGSTAHAIFLPFQSGEDKTRHKRRLYALLDVGEGCLTSLQRYSSSTDIFQEDLRHVRLIWISHGHLDHYGGLPTVLAAIAGAGGRSNQCSCNAHSRLSYVKRARSADFNNIANQSCSCKCNLPPVVIAPSKVLRFLDQTLNTKHGVAVGNVAKDAPSANSHRLFYAVRHRDFECSPFAEPMRHMILSNPPRDSIYRLSLLRSIQVEHCAEAHGVVIGFENNSSPIGNRFYICFSGDTRPSQALVAACSDLPVPVSLLIHEATFDDDRKVDAIKKRHSTVSEALSIARQMHTGACLMTHFSQRYPRLPFKDFILKTEEKAKKMDVCCAMDGMLIPLGIQPSIFSELYEAVSMILMKPEPCKGKLL